MWSAYRRLRIAVPKTGLDLVAGDQSILVRVEADHQPDVELHLTDLGRRHARVTGEDGAAIVGRAAPAGKQQPTRRTSTRIGDPMARLLQTFRDG